MNIRPPWLLTAVNWSMDMTFLQIEKGPMSVGPLSALSLPNPVYTGDSEMQTTTETPSIGELARRCSRLWTELFEGLGADLDRRTDAFLENRRARSSAQSCRPAQVSTDAGDSSRLPAASSFQESRREPR